MPDGAVTASPALIPLGVHLALPMADYLADPGLSGSGFSKLEANAPDWKWEQATNHLYDPPQEDSYARLMGSVCHTVVLEGGAAFDAQYCVMPELADHPDALNTAAQMSEWLADRGLKKSGAKAELIDRVLAHDPTAKIWDAYCDGIVNGRIPISFKMDAQARMLDAFVRSDPDYAKLLSGGLSEVSIFWEDDGVRYKSRIDYLRPTAVVDLKTFGRPPRRGLLRSFLADRVSHGDDKQAVHNWRAANQIPALLKSGEITGPEDKIELLKSIAKHPKVFIWLGLRVGGAPCGIAVRFDQGTIPWGWAEQKIAYAVTEYRKYKALYGDGIWIRREKYLTAETAPDASAWPSWGADFPGLYNE